MGDRCLEKVSHASVPTHLSTLPRIERGGRAGEQTDSEANVILHLVLDVKDAPRSGSAFVMGQKGKLTEERPR